MAPNSTEIITHKYTLPVNKENKVIISLNVSSPDGICHSSVQHEIQFVFEKSQISLVRKVFGSKDKASYPFIVTPKGAEVKIEGKGVEKKNSNDYFFTPSKAAIGRILFKLNDEPAGFNVRIAETPQARFTYKQMGKQLILTNKSTGADSFVWIINGDKIEKDNISPVKFKLTSNSPKTWSIRLRVKNRYFSSTSSRVISVSI
ncbi:MAG: hypothetical protein HOD37_17110 [Bacteroidetes bacterium]|nr:hypothetical protein [Bacteroidota bacterium]